MEDALVALSGAGGRSAAVVWLSVSATASKQVSAQTVLRENVCFLHLLSAGRSRETGSLLSLVNSEWFRLNGQPSLALRKSEFHGSPHGQALSLSLKDPFFSILCIMQV